MSRRSRTQRKLNCMARPPKTTSCNKSEDKWDQVFAVLRPYFAKLLLVPRRGCHASSCKVTEHPSAHKEDVETWHHDKNAKPTNQFEEVVRHRHKLEEATMWNYVMPTGFNRRLRHLMWQRQRLLHPGLLSLWCPICIAKCGKQPVVVKITQYSNSEETHANHNIWAVNHRSQPGGPKNHTCSYTVEDANEYCSCCLCVARVPVKKDNFHVTLRKMHNKQRSSKGIHHITSARQEAGDGHCKSRCVDDEHTDAGRHCALFGISSKLRVWCWIFDFTFPSTEAYKYLDTCVNDAEYSPRWKK
mmetsp:Transcript_17454/g.32965  ORF Transcript_17454/g.32965 Transcript_17454/m.32965 type:complete len:301 (+) Transcript_17454:46-948(+)